eukprot:TRINITY_DN13101_c0_g1_i1.p1 TRINITY_DN13101_c0_g1~~TRINITY_DN13101_c0_g1_i1.p1  ORF type:complete len:754 (+),score=192.56 TRINITY_DN13101_c0_g1_i1:567-2828(+)
MLKRKNLLNKKKPVKDRYDGESSEMTEQLRMLEKIEDGLGNVFSNLVESTSSCAATVQGDNELISAFRNFGTSISSENIMLAGCLRNVADFQHTMSEMRLKLSNNLIEKLATPLGETLKQDIQDAKNTHTHYAHTREEFDVACAKIGEKKNVKPKAQEEHERLQLTYNNMTDQTFNLIVDTNQKAKLKTLSGLVNYLEEHYQFFLKGHTMMNGMLAEITRYKDNVTRLEEEYQTNMEERADSENNGRCRVFGESLSTVLSREGSLVPRVITECIDLLNDTGALEVEGIFRISGSSSDIQSMRKQVDRGKYGAFKSVRDPHTVSGLLKTYLRELPEPLFSFEFFSKFVAAAKSNSIEKIAELAAQLPESNRRFLHELVSFFAEVANHSEVNKMTAKNLAVVFAPNVIYSRSQSGVSVLEDTALANKVMEMCINNSTLVFPLLPDPESPRVNGTDNSSSEGENMSPRGEASNASSATSLSTDTDISSAPSSLAELELSTSSKRSKKDKGGPISPRGISADRKKAALIQAGGKDEPAPRAHHKRKKNKKEKGEKSVEDGDELVVSNGVDKDGTEKSHTPRDKKKTREKGDKAKSEKRHKKSKQSASRIAELTSLKFADEEELNAAFAECFSRKSISGWIIIGYQDRTTLCCQSHGRGGVEDLLEALSDGEVQYILIRVPEMLRGTQTTRDIFISWQGQSVSRVESGRKASHVGEVKTVLKPFHAELQAVGRLGFNLETLLARSAPLSGSHVIGDDE